MSKEIKIIIGLVIALAISLCVNVIQFIDNHQEPTEKVIYKTNTVVKLDTVTVVKPEPYEVIKLDKRIEKVPIYISETDTDSVFVELDYEEKVYKEDSLYDLRISGHNPNLDYIKVFPKTTTITNTITKTLTKRNHWNVTVGVGAGYGVFNRKPDVFVGGIVGYSF